MKLISHICSPTHYVDYLKTSTDYKWLNPEEKEKFLVQLFHSKNWEHIKKEDRKFVLQELEDTVALKMKRNPYEIVVKPSDYKWNDFLFDMYTDKINQRYLIRRNLMEDGIKQTVVNGKVKEKGIEYLNLYLLNILYHDQYHIMTQYYSHKSLESKGVEDCYREHLEYLMWLSCHDEFANEVNKKELVEHRYYHYRMVPDEYYAFQYSQKKIQKIFEELEQYYDIDKNYVSYLVGIKRGENKAIFSYQKSIGNYDNISYDDLYKQMLEGYIEEFSLKKNMPVEEIKRDLSLRPSIIEKSL